MNKLKKIIRHRIRPGKSGQRLLRSPLYVAVVAGAIALAAALAPQPAHAQTPQSQIERLNSVIIQAMTRADELGYQGRYDLMDPALREIFNFPWMARAASGGTWRSSTAADQQAMVDAFSRLSIAEFASRFDGFSNERFEVGDIVELQRGFVLVNNTLIQSDGEPVRIDYVMLRDDGPWRIVDIRLGATISELQLKRSEYTSVLRSIDLGDLASLLDDKVGDLEAGS